MAATEHRIDADLLTGVTEPLVAELEELVRTAERSVTLTGEAVDDETMREIARAAVAQAGGAPWPAGTEHS
jgi:hypothetical protein